MMSKIMAWLVFGLALSSTLGAARAESSEGSGLVVTAPWLRATPKSAPVAGGYVTLTNKGPSADRLLGASLPVAAQGQVHAMTMKAGVMHMERLDGLAIPPGATVTLSPGSTHLMFLKPSMPLKEGDHVQGTLVFEKAGTIPVTFAVAGMAAKHAPGASPHDTEAMPGMTGMDMKGMDMKGMDMKGMDMKGMAH